MTNTITIKITGNALQQKNAEGNYVNNPYVSIGNTYNFYNESGQNITDLKVGATDQNVPSIFGRDDDFGQTSNGATSPKAQVATNPSGAGLVYDQHPPDATFGTLIPVTVITINGNNALNQTVVTPGAWYQFYNNSGQDIEAMRVGVSSQKSIFGEDYLVGSLANGDYSEPAQVITSAPKNPEVDGLVAGKEAATGKPVHFGNLAVQSMAQV